MKAEESIEDEIRNIGHVGKSVRKVKAQLEMRLSGDIKGNKKSFYHCVSGKRLNEENAGLQDG